MVIQSSRSHVLHIFPPVSVHGHGWHLIATWPDTILLCHFISLFGVYISRVFSPTPLVKWIFDIALYLSRSFKIFFLLFIFFPPSFLQHRITQMGGKWQFTVFALGAMLCKNKSFCEYAFLLFTYVKCANVFVRAFGHKWVYFA